MQHELDSGNLTVRLGDFSLAWLDQARSWLVDGDDKLLAAARLESYRAEDFDLTQRQLEVIRDSAIACTQFAIDNVERFRSEVSFRTRAIANSRAHRLNVAWLRLTVDCLRYDAAAFAMTLGISDMRLVEALLNCDDFDFAVLCQGDPLMMPRFPNRDAWQEFKRCLTTNDRQQIMTHERQFLYKMSMARQQHNSLDA